MGVVRAGSPPSSPRGLEKEIVQITGDTTITANHNDRLLQVNSSSTVTLTLPRDLPVGTHFEWERYGTGALIFAAASGATLHGANTTDRAGARYSAGFCTVTAQGADGQGRAAVWNLSGGITDSTGPTTSSTAELDFNDGSLAGTAVASKTLVLGANKNIDTIVIADGGLKLGAGAGTAVTSTAAELNILDNATSTTAELNLLDNTVASVSWAVTAGASNICVLTGTIKDAAGATIAASRPLLVYISEAATGIGISADTYSTGAAVSTGTQLVALTANKAWLINTHTDGTFAISITDTAKPADQYAVAVNWTTGQLSISAASAALWGA